MMEIVENRDAQFLLLAGFILAMGLVITALLLNALIFTGSMALEAGTDPSKNEIVNLIEITSDEVKNAYRNATNDSGINQTQKISYFTKQMRNFSAEIPKIYALHAEGVNVTWDASTWNNNRYPNFTENGLPGGAPNWTVVEGVNASTVYPFKLEKLNFSGSFFIIEARNSSGFAVWSVELNSTLGYTMKNITNTSYGSFALTSVELTSNEYYFKESTSGGPVSIGIMKGNIASGTFWIQGLANNRIFYRERHYIVNTTVRFSTNRVRANISIPVSVPW